MKDTKSVSDERTTASSYILNFYTDVMQLNHFYAQYVTYILELEAKYGSKPDKFDDADKQIFINKTQEVRYFLNKIYVQFVSIASNIDDVDVSGNLKEVKKHFNDMKAFNINREALEGFVISLNSFLIKKVMRGLLESSQDYLNKLYSE